MRIWLNPDKMALLGVTVGDVENAVDIQNRQYAAGRVGAAPTTPEQQLFYTVTTEGQLLTAEEFGNITIRSDGPDGIIRLKDIARVEVGKRSYDSYNLLNSAPAITVAVYLQTGGQCHEYCSARERTQRSTVSTIPRAVLPIPLRTIQRFSFQLLCMKWQRL